MKLFTRKFTALQVILILQLGALHAEVSLQEKIGQMIMVGFPGTEIPDSLKYDIEHRNLGGIVTLGWNLENPSQIEHLTDSLQNFATTPLFIAVDQEGGVVARLSPLNGFELTETAFVLGTTHNSETRTRGQAAKMAGWLQQTGLNVNLAPVADVNVNPSSPAIGYYGRSFSANSAAVANHISWFVDEFQNQGIITSLKHYPGHGSAQGDSHAGFTDITNTWSNDELYPYEYMINQGFSDMVMTGHLFNAHIDSVYPATLSRATITHLLRDSLGFDGVVISDALNMGAIRNNYSFDETIELAINAGVDVLLYITNMMDDYSVTGIIIDIVEDKIAQGLVSEQTIEASYSRIMALKARLIPTTGISPARSQQPPGYSMHVYPNPFNATARLVIQVPKATPMRVELLNVRGQVVQVLSDRYYSTGSYELQIDGAQLGSGIYFVRQTTALQSSTTKVSLIK